MSAKTYKMEKMVCPNCGVTLSAATGISEVGPKPGDFGICVKCECYLEYGGDGKILIANTEDMTDRELADLERMKYNVQLEKIYAQADMN